MQRSYLFIGRHHWTNEKLFKVTKVFIQKEFDFNNPTDYETWALLLLLNPVKGILESKKKTLFNMPACAELYNTLKDEGLQIFRDIFINNNRQLIQKFFTNSIIRKLWPYIQRHLTFQNCFKRSHPCEEVKITYALITCTLIDDFDLTPPSWWLRKFKYTEALDYACGAMPSRS